MSGYQRDIRRRSKAVEDASRRVDVEDGEVGVVDSVDKRIAAGVDQGRIPRLVVAVEVAADDSVSVRMSEDGVEVRRVGRRKKARRSRRDVDVVDV